MRARVWRRPGGFDNLCNQLRGAVHRQRRRAGREGDRRPGGRQQRHALTRGRDQSQRDRAKRGNPGKACSCYIQDSRHLSAMKVIGQDKGYAMAALLIAMSIAAVLMTVAMPTWKQMSRREK